MEDAAQGSDMKVRRQERKWESRKETAAGVWEGQDLHEDSGVRMY